MRAAAVIGIAGVLVFAASPAAGKKRPKKTYPERGSVVFGKGKALFKVQIGGGTSRNTVGKPVEVASLGFRAKRITKISAGASGRHLLVSTEGANHYWVDIGIERITKDSVPVVRHVCRGRATMTTDGTSVLCQVKDGSLTLEAPGSGAKSKELGARGHEATIAGNATDEVVVISGNGIEAISAADPAKKRTLGVLEPTSDLLVAPDGKRAVAVFKDDSGSGLYSFLFDGKGIRRKLVTDSVPVAWSRDSQWLVVTRKKRGCVVRAAGGQYRCFDGYRALDVSPDLKDALLVSGSAGALKIYRASLGGARSSKPELLVKSAQGAACWIK